MKEINLLAAAVFCLGLMAHAQDVKSESSLVKNPVYLSNCSKCHGKTAQGRFMAGPSLLSEKATSIPAADLRSIITKGRHHMPKFEGKLSPTEIDGLVDQIKSQKK